ncbi:Sacsin [Bagarius yarrelli]|uniref:Sacsin n=1 Tax=Bagarius yarrelli TaxID=175774 RepID=A0A556U4D7_BAGYA|nr:Sacsin [Bagarius yarrelli]
MLETKELFVQRSEYGRLQSALNELIQNADDAGASKTVFIYDERQYGTSSVWSPALGKYQGPALYAFNDAVFTEEDWEGIQRAGRSIKHNDPTKVGRFGIGFNSVYHVTDLPCVLSSKHLAIFDPQKLMFDDEREGYRWSLHDVEDRKHLLEFTDQFKPFQDVVNKICESDCAWEKIINECYFKGTLFRFPLRHEASEISDNLYDSKKATQLLDSFIPDADISVLFLRSVTSISLLHIDSNGSVTNKMNVSASSSSSLIQESGNFRKNCLQGKTSFKTISCSSPCQKVIITKWLLTACRLTEGHAPEIDTLAGKLSFYPQVDIAIQCEEDRTCGHGRLSCFLPLPNNETNKTGLPIHINACFGLTDNRRYIKWQEEDQKTDESAVWNELLMKKVLPHVYLKIIQDSIQLSKRSLLPVSAVYNLWPDLRETRHRPRWHEVAVDLFQRLFQNQEIFSLAKNNQKWVAVSDAVFPNNNKGTDEMSAVFHLLVKKEENLVTVPEHVLLGIKETFPNADALKWVTPTFVRSVLHKSDIASICKNEKLSILEYVLSDGRYEELNGLQLLPLNDGSFRSFTNREEDTALIDNENFSRVLLPFCKDRFLYDDLNLNTVHHLRHMAKTNSKLYQVINLDANNVAAFAKKHLPRDWKETTGHVKWNFAKDDHPPKTWLKEFWKFLNTHWTDLRAFIGMPLIPLEPIQQASSAVILAKLEEKSTLIFQSSRESTFSDQMQKVVKAVGGTVIKKDECLKHHDIENYVLSPSPRNVLHILLHLDIEKVVKGIASLSVHDKEEFKTYISSLDSLSNVEQDLLLALPIFKLMSEKYVVIMSKQAVYLKSNPSIPKDLPVPGTIVQCVNEPDRRLLTLLKVELLDSAELAIYLVDLIDGIKFSKEDEQKIMAWILNHGQLLFSQSEELLRKCKNLSFIHTENGERKRPSSIFDPTNKTFLDLFEENFFPPQVFRSPNMIQSLKQIGLQTKEEQLTPANVLYVASQIQKHHILSRNKAFKKADVLIRVLNENDLLSNFSEEERQELLQLQWVPCTNPNSIRSQNQKRCLYKPTEIRASKYSAIVGHVMPLASDLNENICQKLDLNSSPPAEKVLENLCVLSSLAPTMVNPDSDYEFKNKLHSTYKFMQDNVGLFKKEINNKCDSWLWTQTEFVSPREVVLTYPAELDLSLYIKRVADEFLQYEDLLRECGVKETLADEEIEAILSDIKVNIDDRSPPYGELSELKVSTAILDWMRKNEKTLKESTPVPVMAENRNFTLQPLKTTLFCDISPDGLDDLKEDKEEFYVIHEEVLPVTARWLKIPFLSTRILKPQIIGHGEEYEGIEQCGQTEPITQRIKNILKEYDDESDIFKELIQNAEDAGASTCGFLLDFRTHPPEGLIDDGMALCNGPCLWAFNNGLFSDNDWKNVVKVGSASKENKIEKIGKFGLAKKDILKELLQNADDAKATEIHFVWDKRKHGTRKIFGERWELLQGPALCVYNNRKFSDEDLIGIQQLGEGGKQGTLGRTGKYGLGFNSVYQLTDCPSILTGDEYLCICDPNLKYVEAGTTDSPGCMYSLDENFKESFQDVYHTFLPEKFPLNSGTMFRLPLRTEDMAAKSEISINAVRDHEILELFQALKEDSEEMILFLRNITEIHLHEINKDGSEVDYFLIEKNITENTEEEKKGFYNHVHNSIKSGIVVPCQAFYEVQITSGKKGSHWIIAEQYGSFLQNENTHEKVPQAGLATCVGTKLDEFHGKAFCSLPLPGETGLPVHVNGNFEVDHSRRDLWKEDEIATIKFIVAMQVETKLCNYHKAFAQGKDMVAIKESLLENHHDHPYLIWTAMPILPTRNFTPKELNALKNAGALDKPPPEQVMQNLKHICRSQCRTEELVETRATVFRISYAYLQSVNFNESLLADVPLVLVENDRNLVKPNQVVLTLPYAFKFRPYLYTIQSKDAMFAEFFKKTGVNETPSVTQLCTVLEEIYTECFDKTTLQPNQQRTVRRVVQQLFCLISKKGKVTDFPKNTLYLPSTDGKLYKSSTLFFNDTTFQANRLEDALKTKLNLLVKLNQCHLKDDPYEHQKLLQSLPEQIQPKLLSQVISVNLVGAHVEHCEFEKSCEFSGFFQNRLSSREFCHGVICLIREQSKGAISQTEAAHMCEKTFGRIQIVCCKTLHTELLLNHQPLEGTKTETQVYVEKQEDGCVFYLKHNDNMAPKVVNEVNMLLTREINALLKNFLHVLSLPVLGQLLLCEDIEDVKRVLEQHGVHNTMSGEEGLGFRPSPGTPIPEEWRDSLDMDFLNNFEKGEYVGFKKDDSENGYVFAIVVECLDDTRGNLLRYRIQIENEEIIEVSSLDLYQFKREKRSAPVENNTCTDIVPDLLQSETLQTKQSRSEQSRSDPSQSEPTWFLPSPKRPLPQTLEEVKIEIDQSLEVIWKMSEEDKSKAIRRLYLRWHPDKNPDNTALATEAFKYLLKRIEELQQGKAKHNKSTQSNAKHYDNFKHFYDQWNNEAGSHRRGRERFYQNNSRRQYNFWSHFRETPVPNREEAKRWYRQAQCDILAAQSDTGYNASPEWCLFKVHQAVEKALIATEFRRNGRHPGNSSGIMHLAQKISQYATYLKDLPRVVNQLRALGVDAKRTQYPTFHPSPHIPNGQFKSEDAEEAVKIATDLLIKLDKYITE